MDDGLLEVVGVTGVVHMVSVGLRPGPGVCTQGAWGLETGSRGVYTGSMGAWRQWPGVCTLGA